MIFFSACAGTYSNKRLFLSYLDHVTRIYTLLQFANSEYSVKPSHLQILISYLGSFTSTPWPLSATLLALYECRN